MISVAPIYEEPYKRTQFSNYEACSAFERKKLELGYKRLKEYTHFYLYGKYDYDGNLLYKECFSKFDIDKPKNPRKAHNGPIFRF